MAITTTSATTIIGAPPAATKRRFTASVWTVLAAESVVAAGFLHVIVGVQNLNEYLLFGVLFLGVAPLQVLFGNLVSRGVRPVAAVVSAVVAIVVIAVYIHSRENVVTNSVAPVTASGGSPRSTDLPATLMLACEMIAVGGLGTLVPATMRSWLVRSLLTVGVVFWLVWFSTFIA
jgi:hypothetical protein